MLEVELNKQPFVHRLVDHITSRAKEEVAPLKSSGLGTLSLILALIGFTVLGIQLGGFGTVLTELKLFLTGQATKIPSAHGNLGEFVRCIGALVPIEFVASIVAIAAFALLPKMKGKHELAGFLLHREEKHLFRQMFVVMLIEEVLARGLFLGLGRMIPFLDNTIGIYLLFLLGNGLWALIHLGNFKAEEDRQVLRVLPQFVGGIVYTVVFLKFGLIASILTHSFTNCVLFSTMKLQRVNWIDAAIGGYGLLLAVVSYFALAKPLSAVSEAWFSAHPVLEIEGWHFWDYTWFALGITGLFTFIANLMLLDQNGLQASKTSNTKLTFWNFAVGIVIVLVLVTGWAKLLLIGCTWLGTTIGLNGWSEALSAVIVSLSFCFLHKGQSGSAVARSFFISLPTGFVMAAVIKDLGFFPAIGFLAFYGLLSLPIDLLKKLDD